jgi:TolB-like protein/AraC-like DNA-binding protein/Tfp pilus assembly protein PilF
MIKPPTKDQLFISKLTDIILANIGNENFGVKELIQESGMSRHLLIQRLHAINNKNINQFIREIRLQKALEMLKNGKVTASEVAYKVGFSSPAYFNTCFNEFFGFPPGHVKEEKLFDITEIKPAEVTAGHKQKKHAWRTIILLSSGILFLVVLFYLVYNIFFKNSSADAGNLVKIKEKSIAILPFKNLSTSIENQYFIDGMMEEIFTDLSKIHDLRIVPRRSVEQFRETSMSVREIAKKLNVEYLVTGSGQKYDGSFRLRVQLIEAKNDKQLWANSYEKEINGPKDIYSTQNEIAQSIASELKATITPEEKKLIEKTPTTNLKAYDLYMKGNEILYKWWATRDNQYIQLALNFFNEALKIDPEYLDLLSGKGNIYSEEGKYDSARIYFERVLKIDGENRNALEGLGGVYMDNNKTDSALKYFQRMLEVSPSDLWPNFYIGQELIFGQNKVIKGLPYFQKAYDLGGSSQAAVLMNIGFAYFFFGEYTKALKYIKETLLLEPSWCGINQDYFNILYIQGNCNEALSFLDSIQNFTTCGSACDIMRFYYYTLQRDFKKAGEYSNKALNVTQSAFIHADGYYDIYYNYLLKETGMGNEAIKGLKKSIEYYEADMLKAHVADLTIVIKDRLKTAASFAMLGENEKALKYLSQLEKFGLFEYPITLKFPGFDNLRNDPEFKAIVKRIEDQRAATRAKVREMEQSGELHL